MAWSQVTNLKGPQGAAGTPGATGATGSQGPVGGQGPAGSQGPKGDPGQSVSIEGQVATSSALTSIGDQTAGDGYITSDTGHLWVYQGPNPNDNVSKWTDVGNITGPAGAQGPAGSQGPQGVPGNTGSTGSPGARGNTWFTGPGAPGSVPGAIAGDLYLDLSTGDTYKFS